MVDPAHNAGHHAVMERGGGTHPLFAHTFSQGPQEHHGLVNIVLSPKHDALSLLEVNTAISITAASTQKSRHRTV